MPIDIQRLTPTELVRLLNSTPQGTVISAPQLHRQMDRAGYRIGDGRTINFLRYTSWLAKEFHKGADRPTYQDRMRRQAEREKFATMTASDIAPIPDVANPERRAAATARLQVFCETYFQRVFYRLPWSDDHIRVLGLIEKCILDGGLFAFAMPRGSGKTTLARMAGLWAILTGARPYVCLIGGSEDRATDLLLNIRRVILSPEATELRDDFPEALYPLWALRNNARKQIGQHLNGEPTYCTWAADKLIFPTVSGDNLPPSLRDMGTSTCSGSIITVTSLDSNMRGQQQTKMDGTIIRPSLVLLDDPQTRQALDVDTPIATDCGFKRMGDICVGDRVFDERGILCHVTDISPVFEGRRCYRVVFDDDSSVVADAGHLWETSTALQRTNQRRRITNPDPSYARRPQCQPKAPVLLRTTEDIRCSLYGEGGRLNHSIEFNGELELPKRTLPVPPYTLGAWLGDGHSACGRITGMDNEVFVRVMKDGFDLGKEYRRQSPPNQAVTRTVLGLGKLLRKNGLLHNKHIPSQYYFAAYSQRLDLLRGLLDTDGWVSFVRKGVAGPRCNFANTNKKLIDGVVYLCRSIGIKARITYDARLNEVNACPIWNVSFITTLPVFTIMRKAARLPSHIKPSSTRRYVAAIVDVHSRPVKCIAVDSPSHLYLCGDALIPTHNSARSASQTAVRLQLLNGDVLGLAGPGEKIAAFLTCTKIYEGDLADSVLDRKRYPQWQGICTKMVYSWPTNTRLWDQYRALRDDSLRTGNGGKEATEFYATNREAMDVGGKVAWEIRKNDDEISAIQHAFNLRCDMGEEAFEAEYQNEPSSKQEMEAIMLSPQEVAERFNGRKRGEVPADCSKITAFIDVHKEVLFYCVVAWRPDFTGYVIDYGTEPDQRRSYFTLANATRTLTKTHPHMGDDGAIQAGLEKLVGELLGRPWQHAGGGVMRIDRLLVDMGYKASLVAAVKHKAGGSTMVLAKGIGLRAGTKPIAMYQRRAGWTLGFNWYSPSVRRTHEFPHVCNDVNYWKSFVHAHLAIGAGDPGALTFFGTHHSEHTLFAEHISGSESYQLTFGQGRQVQEWRPRVERPDNHWFDCLVGCCAAASQIGVGQQFGAGREVRKKVRIADLKAEIAR